MPTVHYRNAVLVVGGADISGDVTDLNVEISCESLDATAMGATTRVHKGGLLVGKVSGVVFYESGQGLSETVLYPMVGLDDQVITVYPNGITEGSSAIGSGYMTRGVCNQFDIGGKVGTLLPITFAFESRGYGL